MQQSGRGLSERVTFTPGAEKGKGRNDLTTGGASSQSEGMICTKVLRQRCIELALRMGYGWSSDTEAGGDWEEETATDHSQLCRH